MLLSRLNHEGICLIPFCPEVYGGLPTPRIPCEIAGGRVVGRDGTDFTGQFETGARQALKLARLYGCRYAVLKDRSPSCGCGMIYDGTFTGTLTVGSGIAAGMLAGHGIRVINEDGAEEFFASVPARELQNTGVCEERHTDDPRI